MGETGRVPIDGPCAPPARCGGAGAGDTIFAVATAPGRAGVAVVRLSGPAAGRALCRLAGLGRPPPPRRAVRCALRSPVDGAPLDDGLALWFPGPASLTGEDVAELHIHGGRATVEAVCATLAREGGLRPADAGEFSRRAFLAGKLDLAEAEGLADLVDAETEGQRRQALRQLRGGLSERLGAWRAELLRIAGHIEAAIDFADEEVPDDAAPQALAGAAGLEAGIRAFLDDSRRGERMRDGLHVAIVGAPNAGKSSLLNALAERDAAIVSGAAGTTRDVVEVRLDLDGWPVVLADTAGLRPAASAVEGEGVRRARERAREADLRLVVFDGTRAPDAASVGLLGDGAVAVVNKTDLGAAVPAEIAGVVAVGVSALTGDGLAGLLEELAGRAAAMEAGPGAPLTRVRHRLALEECADAVARARAAPAPELAAEDLRLAARALGRVTGAVDVEDLLDVVFREFCIGK